MVGYSRKRPKAIDYTSPFATPAEWLLLQQIMQDQPALTLTRLTAEFNVKVGAIVSDAHAAGRVWAPDDRVYLKRVQHVKDYQKQLAESFQFQDAESNSRASLILSRVQATSSVAQSLAAPQPSLPAQPQQAAFVQPFLMPPPWQQASNSSRGWGQPQPPRGRSSSSSSSSSMRGRSSRRS